MRRQELSKSSTTDQPGVLTVHLRRWSSQRDQGSYAAIAELADVELHRIAVAYMSRERAAHTLQPTALVNECHLRLLGDRPIDWRSRAHFLAIAARRMRQILVDHARQHKAQKRGGDVEFVAFDEAIDVAEVLHYEAIHEALNELETLDASLAQLVLYRFFGGLTQRECAEVQGVPLSEITRQWNFAKAWLQKSIGAKGKFSSDQASDD